MVSRRLNFFVVGAARSGTTSLDQLFRLHPKIEMPGPGKEAHHFEHMAFDAQHRPTDDYRNFHEWFSFNRPTMGLVTPSYIVWPLALERIKVYNPQAKIIALLRNPVIRAHSNWALGRANGSVRISFRESLEKERATPGFKRWHSNIARGIYSKQIERVRALFPVEQILFIKSEEFFEQQSIVFNRICEFIGANTMPPIAKPIRAHAKQLPERLTLKDWQFAYPFFADDIPKVETMLDWDCSDWRAAPPL